MSAGTNAPPPPDSPTRRSLVMLVLAGIAAGCSLPGTSKKSDCVTGARATADRAAAAGLSEQRVILSEGYSQLYTDAGHLDETGWIRYAKTESDAVGAIITAIADFGEALKAKLEKIAADYPGVRIDLDPLPEMEKRKRLAIGWDRAHYFAPFIGRSGREYERTILIGFSGGLNHERHMCQVMAEEEPDASLRKFLVDTAAGFDKLYFRTEALLEKEYFSDPNGKSRN